LFKIWKVWEHLLFSSMKITLFSSPELKAQVSFSDRLLSVVLLSVRHTHMEVLVIKITCELQKVQTLFVSSTFMSVKCGVTEKLKLWKEMSMTCVVNRLLLWAAPLKMKNISNSYMYHSIVHYFKLINNFQVVVKTYGFHSL
jgi:hypothetical protein